VSQQIWKQKLGQWEKCAIIKKELIIKELLERNVFDFETVLKDSNL